MSTSAEILAREVFSGGANVAFGQLTLAAVRERAAELGAAVGWGPMARVAPVAAAWRELAARMERAGAVTVAELPAEVVEALAGRLWVVPPGGSLLG